MSAGISAAYAIVVTCNNNHLIIVTVIFVSGPQVELRALLASRNLRV